MGSSSLTCNIYFRVVSIWPLKQENACIKHRRKESLFCTQTTPEGMYQAEILLPFLTSSRCKVYAPIHPPSTYSWNGLLQNNTNHMSRIIIFYSLVLLIEIVFYKLIKSDYKNKFILVGAQRWLACTVSICKTLWPLNKNIDFFRNKWSGYSMPSFWMKVVVWCKNKSLGNAIVGGSDAENHHESIWKSSILEPHYEWDHNWVIKPSGECKTQYHDLYVLITRNSIDKIIK